MKQWVKNNPGKTLIAFVCSLPTGVIFAAVGLKRAGEVLNDIEYAKDIFYVISQLNPFALFASGIAMIVFASTLYIHSTSLRRFE